MSDTVQIVSAACLGVALIALAVARRDPWAVRIAGLGAVLVAWLAASDRGVVVEQSRPPRVLAVLTEDALPDALRAAVAGVPGAEMEQVVASDFELGAAAAWARAAPGVEVVLVWTAPFDVRARAEHGADGALTVRGPAAIEPGDVRIVASGPLRVGRPGRFSVRYADGVPVATRVSVEVRSPGADDVLEGAVGTGPFEFECTFRTSGEHTVAFLVECGPTRMRGTGTIEVAPAPRVGVLGRAARPLVAALRVQGIDAVSATLDDIDDFAAIVALEPLGAEQQQRLVAFVDRGGGLFAVGGEHGGALPAPGEPLHAWMPVDVLERRFAAADESETGTGAAPNEPTGVDRPQETEDPAVGEIDAAGVEPKAPPVEVERRHVSLAIVIDQSGSMSEEVVDGATRMDFAKRSAFETLAELESEDRIGIIGFDVRAREILSMRRKPSLVELERALENASVTMGGTHIAVGLERAAEWLLAERSAVKHAVVLTDADRIGMDPGDIRRARVLATRLQRGGVTVSVLHISAPGDDVRVASMAEIARLGGGQLHRAEDASRVPRLLVAEVQRVLGGLGRGAAADREPDADAVGADADGRADEAPAPDESSDGLDPAGEPEVAAFAVRAIRETALVETPAAGEFPTLSGIADVAGRQHTHTLLVAGDLGVPLLAFANRGLGRVGAWTSDLTGAWGRDWLRAPEFPSWFARWVSFLLPPAASAPMEPIGADAVLDPVAPTRAEREELEWRAGGPLGLVERYEIPPARAVAGVERRGDDDALLAFAAILLVAFVEFMARRMRVG